MNYFSGYLANAERRLAEIRKRHELEDAAEITQRNRKNRMGAPLTDDLGGPILNNRNARGPDNYTRRVAWACDKFHEDTPWKAIAKRAGMQTTVLKALVKRYEALGGMTDGTLMNGGELSMKTVLRISTRMKVAKPCDADLVKWLKTGAGRSFVAGTSKTATDVHEYATKHGILQDGLGDLGFSLHEIKRIGKILGKVSPSLDDVTTFLARNQDEAAQIRIAGENGVLRVVSLLKRLRKAVPVPDEYTRELHLDGLAKREIAKKDAGKATVPTS